ncbi:MAG: cytochrome c maturation protein CcmE [Ilumatobacteraceae bacterium]
MDMTNGDMTNGDMTNGDMTDDPQRIGSSDDEGSQASSSAPLDLSPRVTKNSASRRRRPWGAIVVLALVVVTGFVVITKFLTSAVDYYCNVDEIGRKEGCEAGRRLRVQGVVEQGSVADDGTVTTFDVAFNGESVSVRYEGDPGGIFKECIPVVVHGVLNGDTFMGDRIEVKHSNEYEAENPDRVSAPEGTECSPSA